uniref:Uncharacterized protein n=1 Tax=Tanacetum cinerariifolium TaxID=118510 RepID=A0A6L2N6K2_TANCI|nr:hypothetical protein [Tanacetum cinerariifolium]
MTREAVSNVYVLRSLECHCLDKSSRAFVDVFYLLEAFKNRLLDNVTNCYSLHGGRFVLRSIEADYVIKMFYDVLGNDHHAEVPNPEFVNEKIRSIEANHLTVSVVGNHMIVETSIRSGNPPE